MSCHGTQPTRSRLRRRLRAHSAAPAATETAAAEPAAVQSAACAVIPVSSWTWKTPCRERIAMRKTARFVFAGAAAAAGAALALAGCASTGAGASAETSRTALQTAIAAPTRTPANLARDRYRHPLETLSFFGVRPSDTVVEIWPGGGWYSEILAPYVAGGGGTYYAASLGANGNAGVRRLMEANPALYGNVRLRLPRVRARRRAC